MISKTHLTRLFKTQFELEQDLKELKSTEAVTTCGHCSPIFHETRGVLKKASSSIDVLIDSYLAEHGQEGSQHEEF